MTTSNETQNQRYWAEYLLTNHPEYPQGEIVAEIPLGASYDPDNVYNSRCIARVAIDSNHYFRIATNVESTTFKECRALIIYK